MSGALDLRGAGPGGAGSLWGDLDPSWGCRTIPGVQGPHPRVQVTPTCPRPLQTRPVGAGSGVRRVPPNHPSRPAPSTQRSRLCPSPWVRHRRGLHSMAPALGSVAVVATVAWGLATILLLLLLCSFFHRTKRPYPTPKMGEDTGLVRGVKLARLGSGDGGTALPGDAPSPGDPRQQENSPAVRGDTDNPAVGDPKLHVPGWTPHSHAPSSPSSRTPEFLRHRQLPVLPGDAGTAATDPVPDAEGRIYESIRYKPGTLKKPQDAGSTLGDSGDSLFLTRGDEPSVPELDITAQEELDSKGDPSPVYARVCKPPRGTQPRQPHSPPEPQEEAPPALPEKRFDVV
ncbi:uncharacterized protein LOC135578956 [Columba livia]|uniref:uncharacterized protein LOC135578956 n=1 Tax=Columba livia TaxID=8932 RepID=UPI0031BA345C